MSSSLPEPERPSEPAPGPVAEPPAAETPAAEAPARPQAPARLKIGSQRDQPKYLPPAPPAPKPAPKPAASDEIKPMKADPVPSKFPPPNVRSRLTPDMELEFAAAMGDVQLDEVMASQQAADESPLEPETKVRGRVVAVQRDQVFLELGGRRQGVLPLVLFPENPPAGSTLEVMVCRLNPDDGLYELALPGAAIAVEDWSQVHEGMTVDARVTGHNKGGLECDVNRLRGFIPLSQVAIYRVEDVTQFVGQTLRCVVTEANAEKRNLVLSHRAILEREKAEAREQLLAALEVGQVREGVVRKLQDFGAFVDLGGVDGLIHIAQLSWDRIKHPSEVLSDGQRIKVKVLKIDSSTGKISLGFRDLLENPWSQAQQKYPLKSRVTGRVTRIADFGAFVRLEPGIEGLVHISELSHKRVFRVSDVLKEGQEVEVQIQSVDAEAQRIGLSMKALETRPESAKKESADEATPEPETPPQKTPARKTPLKGGLGGAQGGERFGLKW